jgi:hypothetical protein
MTSPPRPIDSGSITECGLVDAESCFFEESAEVPIVAGG